MKYLNKEYLAKASLHSDEINKQPWHRAAAAQIVSDSNAPPKRGPLPTAFVEVDPAPNLPADPANLPPDPLGILQLPLSTQLLLPQPTQSALLLLHPTLLQIADDATATANATLEQWRFSAMRLQPVQHLTHLNLNQQQSLAG